MSLYEFLNPTTTCYKRILSCRVNISFVKLGLCFCTNHFPGDMKHARYTFMNLFQQLFLNFHNHCFPSTSIQPFLRWCSCCNFVDTYSFSYSCFCSHLPLRRTLKQQEQTCWRILIYVLK